ncbi:MAG: winged helix-turn-helix transcriptional regulator [Clostridia bacterium]|nr:winged helix-turn-helix transcriptional regulator [Clostridia bacterium]
MKQTRKLIEICYLAQTFCQQPANGLTDNEMKVLFFVDQYSCVSPQILISKLGLAKSNLALLTKNLIKNQLIISEQSIIDKRAINYLITPKGQEIVKNYVQNIKKLIRPDELSQNFIDSLSTLNSFLNKKV